MYKHQTIGACKFFIIRFVLGFVLFTLSFSLLVDLTKAQIPGLEGAPDGGRVEAAAVEEDGSGTDGEVGRVRGPV